MAYVPKYISKTIGAGGKAVYKYTASTYGRKGYGAVHETLLTRRGGGRPQKALKLTVAKSTDPRGPREYRTVMSFRGRSWDNEKGVRNYNPTPPSLRRFAALHAKIVAARGK